MRLKTDESKSQNIIFIQDETLSRDNQKILNRYSQSLKLLFNVIKIENKNEDEIINTIHQTSPKLILVPWKKYLNWKEIESKIQLDTQCFKSAGYFCEKIDKEDFFKQTQFNKIILLDFYSCSEKQIINFISQLTDNSDNGTVSSFFNKDATIYTQTWDDKKLLGLQTDIITRLPDIKQNKWSHCDLKIKKSILSLFEYIHHLTSMKPGDITFKISSSNAILIMQVVFEIPMMTRKKLIESIYPSQKNEPQHAGDLLLNNADLIRIQNNQQSHQIEITLGLYDKTATYNTNIMNTIWIDTLEKNITKEKNTLKQIPNIPITNDQQSNNLEQELKNKNMQIQTAARHIIEYKNKIKTLENKITELKSGGVNTPFMLNEQSTQSLLDNIHKKIIETHIDVEKTYLEIHKQSRNGINENILKPLLLKLKQLKEQKKQWQLKLNEINKDMNQGKKEAA